MTQNNLIKAASFIPHSVEAPNAWCGHLPFAAWLIKELVPNIFVELGKFLSQFSEAENTKCQSVLFNDLYFSIFSGFFILCVYPVF